MSLDLMSSSFYQKPETMMRHSARRRQLTHVALAFPMENAHLHQVVHGITQWASRGAGWVFTTFPESLGASLGSIGWRGSGVITAMTCPEDLHAASELGLPCVNISGWLWDTTFPRVTVHNGEVGRLAAEHLLSRGFRRFACYAVRGVRFSDERERGFVQQLRQANVPGEVATLRAEPGAFASPRQELEALIDWLRMLENPLAVFAINDERARMVLEAAATLKLRVPEQVAVLGVDNDVFTCTSSNPPLSSIACDWRRLGYESAAMLERLMSGDDAEPRELLIPPLGVASRRSTDVTVVENVSVAQAVDYVRAHLSEVFGVEALVACTGAPRRSLELAFKRAMGCTPYEFILRARVARARELLTCGQRMRLTTIADACGFADLRRFRMVFRRETGQTPQEYVASQRAHS